MQRHITSAILRERGHCTGSPLLLPFSASAPTARPPDACSKPSPVNKDSTAAGVGPTLPLKSTWEAKRSEGGRSEGNQYCSPNHAKTTRQRERRGFRTSRSRFALGKCHRVTGCNRGESETTPFDVTRDQKFKAAVLYSKVRESDDHDTLFHSPKDRSLEVSSCAHTAEDACSTFV